MQKRLNRLISLWPAPGSPGAVFLILALAIAAPAALAAQVKAQAKPQSSSLPSPSANPVGTESSPQLFAVMCALYASGYPAEASLSTGFPEFAGLESRLLALQGPAVEAMRKYYRDHELADPAATLSRFISFALVSGPGPKFFPAVATDDIPPDALVLEGFREVLSDFYVEAGIDQLWSELQPVYQARVTQLIAPASRIVLLETGYLREVVNPSNGRTFTVYAEPLVGDETDVRNIGDHYAIVVGSAVGALPQLQHAFLHFLLDPLPIRYDAQIYRDTPVFKAAARAPQLPEQFRSDYEAYFTECLVRAAELRLRRLPAAGQAEELDRNDGQGYVLVRPLLAALVKFEAAQPSIDLYFPDLLASIDPGAELKRVQAITFSPDAPEPDSTSAELTRAAPAHGKLRPDLQASLDEGERLIAAQDADGAAAAFQRVLDGLPGQPRALYGLAVASILQGDADKARDLFAQVVASVAPANAGTSGAAPPDPVAFAWSHIFLGRMHDLDGDRPAALLDYHAVLAVNGAPDDARDAAQHGIEQAYQPPAH
jgi:tetratricopeptide (TPR) repeat protein